MSIDFKKYTITLPSGTYILAASLHTSGYRFKIGDVIRYRGPSQGAILAPGDDVEIVRLGADPSYYIVKLAGSFTTHTWMVKDTDLEPTYSLPYQYSISDYDAVDSSASSSYDDIKIKRKENGECEACGKKREMSIFGLSDCSCTPQLPARW